MMKIQVSIPQLAFVAVTRALGGIGLGLLLSSQLGPRTRRRVGWTLLTIGAMTTLPIAAGVLRRRVPPRPSALPLEAPVEAIPGNAVQGLA